VSAKKSFLACGRSRGWRTMSGNNSRGGFRDKLPRSPATLTTKAATNKNAANQ
jgi:hypothetical protein